MKNIYPCILILTLIWGSLVPGNAQSAEKDYAGFLRETMHDEESFWVRVHAAEALIANNFQIGVDTLFRSYMNSGGSEKVGALRLLARENTGNTRLLDSIEQEILKVFHKAETGHSRLVALETMGKLGFKPEDPTIQEIAGSGQGGIATLAQWVLAGTGKDTEIQNLAEYLSSPDTLQYRYAAYALRFLEKVPESVYHRMEQRYKEMDQNHPFRIYLVSALWVHQPSSDLTDYLSELKAYSEGEIYERYELYQALAVKGGESVLPFIEEGFADLDTDVKVSVAEAYLANEHFSQSRIGWLDWVILIAYGVLLLGIGWGYSYYQKSKEDYFLGGRNAHPVVTGISMYVSFFSAITYLAIAGEVIKYGPLMALTVMSTGPLIFIIGSYFLLPFFMNLNVITAYEILQKPLGMTVRKLASIIFLVTRIVWMALLIYLASKSMVVMMGWSDQAIFLITVILGIITIVYTTMGGLKAVLVTDVIQFVILLLGAIATIWMVAIQFGGVGNLIPTKWAPHWPQMDVVNFNPYVRLTVFFAFINTLTWWVATTGSDQMAIQRFLSTKDLKSARKSFAVTQIGMMVMTLVLMFVGFSVMKFYDVKPNLLPGGGGVEVEADFLFPHFIANQFPMGMSGLVIAALFSASMSSLSSGINSTSSVLTIDLLPGLFSGNSSKNELTGIRISSAAIGIVVILLSVLIPLIPGNIIEVTAKTNGLFIAPLFNLFVMGLFVKGARPFGVIMGSVYGLFAAFTVAFWDVLTGYPSWSFLWILITSLIISVVSSLFFNVVFRRVSGNMRYIVGMLLVLPWLVLYYIV